MSTALFSSPTTISELRDLLNLLDLPAETKRYAMAIAWAFPDLLVSHVQKRRLYAFDDWSHADAVAHVAELVQAGVLLVNKNRRSVTLRQKTPAQSKVATCVYCGLRTRRPTRDHVLPKSRGGADAGQNIVDACHACNCAKADRTPEEWARDILDYRKVRKPMTHLPLPYRLRMALTACVAFVMGVIK